LDLIVESPVRTIETNVHCTEVVLAQASKKRKPVFIASTSEVYGKSTSVPFHEDGDLVLGPSTTARWAYACSKAIDEFLALAYWRERKLPIVVTRLFNTVGPRQTGRYGMVVPKFVGQALGGRPLTVFGDGLQTHCFCHVGDVVRALVDLMLLGDGAYGEIFNIGSQEEISILRTFRRSAVAWHPGSRGRRTSSGCSMSGRRTPTDRRTDTLRDGLKGGSGGQRQRFSFTRRNWQTRVS